MRYIKPLFFLLAIIFALVAQAESDKTTGVRKTVDSRGKPVYSQSGFSNKTPTKPKPVEEEAPAPPKPTGPKVDIYYASWDPYSNKAIVFFRENHIVVNAFDIDLDPEAAARKKRIDPSFVGMPLVIINGVVIRGVDEKKYRDALSIKPPQ